MKSALEHCIDEKADRFLVQDDGVVYLQTYGGATVELVGTDASLYLQVAKTLPACGDRKMVNDLVPVGLRADWKLGVQRQDGYTVWTVYSQKLPSFACDASTGSNVNTMKFKTSTGVELSVDLSETSNSGKGESFLLGSNGKPSAFDPLTAARSESVFMLQLLECATGVKLDENQKTTFISVLSDLPEGATLLDLLDAILGIEHEQYKPLEPLFKALQRMQEEGGHAGLFEQRADV
jgi:hypothetical protein